MIWGILLALLLGIVWVNLLVYYVFRSGLIYRYLTKKGTVKESFDAGSGIYLLVLGLLMVAYLVVCDLMVLGYNDFGLPSALLLNVIIVAGLLSYNAYVINGWLIPVVRPMFLGISKMLTPITIRSYTRFSLIQGGGAGFAVSLVSGWVYLMIVGLAR